MAKLGLNEAKAPIPTPKGKLVVKITGERGLRGSNEVYVVAVFQHNEFISKSLLAKDREIVGNSEIPVTKPRNNTDQPTNIVERRQSSVISLLDHQDFDAEGDQSSVELRWNIEAVFDVVDSDPQVNITIYGRENAKDSFLGHADIEARLTENDSSLTGWFQLNGRSDIESGLWGEINVELNFQQIEKKHWSPADFQILRLIGKGTSGQVYQVQKKDTKRVYAMKVIAKKIVLRKKEVAHIIKERNILVRAAITDSPFVVGLKFAFQTPTDLYLVTDFMDGGELFWHLQREGRFEEERTKFYVAELILALQHLHSHGIIYRDLKPENILLDANGHIALSDFSLSKANLVQDATTNSFCGTTEYLAPEVLLDETGYSRMVDFWSLGVLMFEMGCGWSPFYAEDTQQMYKNIAFGKVRFPRDTLTAEARAFVKGLLNRNPKHRLGAADDAEELKRHAFFSNINWDALAKKLTPPPFKPKLKSLDDTANFDPEFSSLFTSSSLNARAAALASGVGTSTPLSPSMQANFVGFTFVDEEALDYSRLDNGGCDDMDDDMGPDQEWDMRGDRMSGISRNDDSLFDKEQSFDL
ncbi:kinase-like domain-containing protein [Halenospora varia]|nr:kinase-like domain-containing protein [Halenospora varia]